MEPSESIRKGSVQRRKELLNSLHHSNSRLSGTVQRIPIKLSESFTDFIFDVRLLFRRAYTQECVLCKEVGSTRKHRLISVKSNLNEISFLQLKALLLFHFA